MNANTEAYIIHLASAKLRAPNVERQRQVLPVPSRIIDAVDARDLSAEKIDRHYMRSLHSPAYPFELGRGEIACFLSHRKAWQRLVETKLGAALIIEDDVSFASDLFPAALDLALGHVDAFDVIRLPRYKDKNMPQRFNQPAPIGLGMLAILVSRRGAEKMLSFTEKFDRPVDTLLQMTWLHGLQIAEISPSGVTEISLRLGGTTIQQRKKPLLAKIRREFSRAYYRYRIAELARRHQPQP